MHPFLKRFLFLFFCTFTIGAFAQHDTTKANLLLEQALNLYDEGKYETARKSFQESLRLRKKHYPTHHPKIEDLYYWMGTNEQGLRDNEKSLEYYYEGLKLALDREGEKCKIVADYYMDIANTLDQMYRIDEAKLYYEKALSTYKKISGAISSDVGNALMNIGYGQRKMGNYSSAEEYYNKAYNIFQKVSDPNSKEFYRIYINRCNLLFDQGNYDKALAFAEKALDIKLMHYDTIHPSVYKYYKNIGRIYFAKNMFEEALPYAKKALNLATISRGTAHAETAGVMRDLGMLYFQLGKLEQALELHHQSVKIQELSLPPNHPYLVSGYEDLGIIYESQGKHNKALNLYEKTIDKYKSKSTSYVPNHLIAITLNNISNVHYIKGNLTKALEIAQNGLLLLAPKSQINKKDIYANPAIEQVQARIEFLDLITSKAKYLYERYKIELNDNDLKAAFNTSEATIELIEKISKSYQSESSKQFLNENSATIFEQAIEQAFELYKITEDATYLKKAFELSEKSKASILRQSIKSQFALGSSNIPQHTIDTLRALESKITRLEEQHDFIDFGDKTNSLGRDIFEMKLAYEESISKLEETNPKYYELKYASNLVSIEKIQDQLNNSKTALIEYFYNSQYLYTFLISNDTFIGKQIPLNKNINTSIETLNKMNTYNISRANEYDHAHLEQINDLYELLISPIISDINHFENLVIVPHGILNLLSYEMLAPKIESDDFRKQEYLIRNFSIQYGLSASLWIKNDAVRLKKSTLSFLGFAPDFSLTAKKDKNGFGDNYRSELVELRYTLPEIEGGRKYLKGKLYTNREASEANFKQQAASGNILHLATHALANDFDPNQSGLFFTQNSDSLNDGFLSINEIYNLNLSAQMTVISACNTGNGQFAKGEGIMSLGRAFLYAGSKSILMSLWLANDQSTSNVMQKFYKYINEGKSKHVALRLAKLDHLQQADALTAHPYFWANMVAVGDMTPLYQKSSFHKTSYLILLGALVLFFVCIRRKLAI